MLLISSSSSDSNAVALVADFKTFEKVIDIWGNFLVYVTLTVDHVVRRMVAQIILNFRIYTCTLNEKMLPR